MRIVRDAAPTQRQDTSHALSGAKPPVISPPAPRAPKTLAHRRARGQRFVGLRGWDQKKIANLRILILGAGAIGSNVAMQAALLGIQDIFICDNDTVSQVNLDRSSMFREADIGQPKAAVVAERVQAINPAAHAHALVGDLRLLVGQGLIASCDGIFCCVDTISGRLALNRLAAASGRRWYEAGMHGLYGHVRVFDPARGACFECGMSPGAWEAYNRRHRCAQPTHEVAPGHIPTFPTLSSMLAGQMLNLLVLDVLPALGGPPTAGQMIHFDCIASTFGRYPQPKEREPDCDSHPSAATRFIALPSASADMPARDFAALAIAALRDESQPPGASADAELGCVTLTNEVATTLFCRHCQRVEPLYQAALEAVARPCPCGGERTSDLLLALSLQDLRALPAAISLRQLGIPPWSVIRVVRGDDLLDFELAADRAPRGEVRL